MLSPCSNGMVDGNDPLTVERDSEVVRVAGEVDVATAPYFAAALAICDSDPIVRALDLTEVDFFSAAGVRCLVERAWPARPHADLIASPHVSRVLDLCGLGVLLTAQRWSSAPDVRKHVCGFDATVGKDATVEKTAWRRSVS
jgi:anti-anti-sigma factor